MRAALLAGALLLLLACVPSSGAQSALPAPSVGLIVEAPAQHAPPGGEPIELPFTADATCDATLALGTMRITYAVKTDHPWLELVVEPSEDAADSSDCVEGVVRFTGRVLARASHEAPAFRAVAIELSAVATSPQRPDASGKTTAPVSAGYYSILDVSADDTQLTPVAGVARAPVKATNFGNGHTRVDFEVAHAEEGLRVERVIPLTLGSRMDGDPNVAQEFVVLAHTDDAPARPLTFTLRWTSAYALDAKIRGDEGELSFVVLPAREDAARGQTPVDALSDRAREAPGPAAALAVIGLGLVALAARRR